MKTVYRIAFLFLIFFTLLFFGAGKSPAVDEESYSCMVCHGEQKVEYKESIHAKMGILCHECHGGDPSSLDQETSMSKKAGFTGKPTKQQLTLLCGNCHADRKRMQPFGIPTHQLDDYKTSMHGIAVLEKNDSNAATCARCHGNHGALPPGVTQVEHVCGQCHIRAVDYFDQSPHLAAMKGNLMAQCISCHEQHRTERADLKMLGPVCTKCHEEGSIEYKRGQQIKTLIVEVQEEIDETENLITEAKLKGIDVMEDQVALERAKSSLGQAIPKIHALNLSLVEENTTDAKSIASDIKLRIHEILESFRLRKVALGFVWLFIFFTVTVLYMKKKRADREFDLQPEHKKR